MEEISIEDIIEEMVSEKTMDARGVLADRAKGLAGDLRAQLDFVGNIGHRRDNELKQLESNNRQLISIAYAMSHKI